MFGNPIILLDVNLFIYLFLVEVLKLNKSLESQLYFQKYMELFKTGKIYVFQCFECLFKSNILFGKFLMDFLIEYYLSV